MPHGISQQHGRDLGWLKEKCRMLVKRDKIVEFLADVANGKSVEQAVGSQGEVISIPASVRDRIKATELLLDRGFGKAEQSVSMDVTDSTNRPSGDQIEEALKCLSDLAKREGMDTGK